MKIVRSFLLSSLLALSLASAATPANAAAGSLDPTFGKGGIAEANVGFPVAAALQPDGKIVVLTLEDKVARFLSNGSLDTSFGNGGSVATSFATSPVALALQSDGKIVLVGQQDTRTHLATKPRNSGCPTQPRCTVSLGIPVGLSLSRQNRGRKAAKNRATADDLTGQRQRRAGGDITSAC